MTDRISTPSLRGRLVMATITVLALATVALDAFVYLALRDQLDPARRTLDRLLLLEVIGSVAVLLVALLVLRRISRLVIRPVDEMVAAARNIAHGRTATRLRPSNPSTELGRMATAFDQTVDAMERALNDARQAEETSRRFLADAAHQLRTPLAGLRASSEALLRGPPAHERDAMLANIARESVRATRLVDSLLQVARLERGDALSPTRMDLAEIIDDEVVRARTLAPHLDIVVIRDPGDLTITGDPQALRDAIANLLDNARQHAVGWIGVTARAGLGDVVVVVSDDGPGVADDAREQVFERFVSLGGDGSGLGLPIARAIARSHAGDLTVDGSTFELRLPRHGL